MTLDLKDFFPSFNFGRVRGFFIRNNHFKLNEKVATIIAQISCYENSLPQGSPCSPIIADLITHLLDVRLVQLAKKYRLTYSRYADDLTFSTSHRDFPPAVAAPVAPESPQWAAGHELAEVIGKAGFAINPTKIRMQFRISRQLVTGLTVNTKVNIRPEYYRWARAMCHTLFATGTYYRPAFNSASESEAQINPIASLSPLGGILSHIHHIKDTIDDRDDKEKREDATAFRKLYAQFLKYCYFVRLERPLIVCEGKTDNIYLKYAIRKLTEFHPKLGSWAGDKFVSAVTFFNYDNKQAHRILGITGGVTNLKYFFIKNRYKKDIHRFKHRPLKHPVIVLIDNDNGARKIFTTLSNNYGIKVDLTSSDPFFHVTDNLYLVKTPEKGDDGISYIEEFFDRSLLTTKLEGKTFNPHKHDDTAGEYSKSHFAEKVVRPNADTIDFSGFAPLLDRIVAVIEHYSPPA